MRPKAWFSLATQYKRKNNSSYFTVKTASSKSTSAFQFYACACSKHKNKDQNLSFCVIALMLALVLSSLVKTRLKYSQVLTLSYILLVKRVSTIRSR